MVPPSTDTTGMAIVARYADFVLASATVVPVAAITSAVSSAPARTAASRLLGRLVVCMLVSSPLVNSRPCLPKDVHHGFPPGRDRRTRQVTGDYPCPTPSEETGQSTDASGEAEAECGHG